MKNEYGLFIIWEKARAFENKIINDIKKRFQILNIFEIEWDKELFSHNLTRFYGENLPKNSAKEQHCGNGKFILIIINDNKPIYGYRNTSKGKKYLNVNLFDSKTLYRSWSGQHRVHGTNDVNEFKHDLMMLLGLNIEDYLKIFSRSEKIIPIKENTVGTNNWKSLEQIFYVLNETINYVVLRNFEKLPYEYETGIHSDIDILCDNRNNISKILNARAAKKSKKRSRYKVLIDGKIVYMDFRYIGDNYYDKKWEKKILNTRELNGCFYIPNKENYKFSLLYHALVQKKCVADDYKKIFEELFYTNKSGELRQILHNYIEENNYSFIDPVDYSVYFNKDTTFIKMRIEKQIYFIFNRIFYKLKRGFKR